MFRRIWGGDIALVWAFWGVGLGGLAFPLGVLMFYLMLIDLGTSVSYANLSFIVLGVIPTMIVWKSASKSVSNFWGKAAKVIVVFWVALGSSLGLIAAVYSPLLFFANALARANTPEFYENTEHLKFTAPVFFRKHTGLDVPEGAKVVHAVYYRHPTMDYEFGHHVILDASNINLGKWIETARPFGAKFEKTTPEPGLEWNAEGLKCGDVKRPEGEITLPVCSLARTPETVWHIKHRLRLDRVVTLTVLEDHNLVWLYETSW